MKIHSEDMARVIDSVPFYSDIQLSQICLDQSNNNKIVYYVKLLKVTYKDRFNLFQKSDQRFLLKNISKLWKGKTSNPKPGLQWIHVQWESVCALCNQDSSPRKNWLPRFWSHQWNSANDQCSPITNWQGTFVGLCLIRDFFSDIRRD